jgi:hypothetical protein
VPFLGVSSNRGQTLKTALFYKKGTFGWKGHFRPEGSAHGIVLISGLFLITIGLVDVADHSPNSRADGYHFTILLRCFQSGYAPFN